MKQAFPRSDLPSKTGLVWIVNGRVLIRPLGSIFTFTANLLRLLAIGHDSPRKTRFHSHSIVNSTIHLQCLRHFPWIMTC